MPRASRPSCLLVLAGAGCAAWSGPDPYYEDWDPPTLTALSVTSEAGNIGGGVLEITGAGFGSDAARIVVQFGDDNAEVLSIEDERLEVRVPQGPISGGAVEVRVATATGYVVADGAYTYDVGDLYAEQIGHIQVDNFWESCLGGLTDRLEEAYGPTSCPDTVLLGYAGIDGVAAAVGVVHPRLHAEHIGFLGGADQAGADWVIERPGQLIFAAPVDRLRQDIGDVVLENDHWSGDEWCPDLDALASYRYGGGRTDHPDAATVSVSAAIDGAGCSEDAAGAYDLSELRFCATSDHDDAQSYVYRPDWPVAKNFFAGDRTDHTVPGRITIRAPEIGIGGLEVDVPESLVVYNEQGFVPVFEGEQGAADLWTLSALEGCFDEDDGSESLDDVALRFTWDRSNTSDKDASFDCEQPGELCRQSTYVRLTLTSLSTSWLGTVGYPVRATIVVPDGTRPSGVGTLDVPASVLYQFPTVKAPVRGGLGAPTGASSAALDRGFLVMTVERVTDYAIRSDAGGTVVFSYTTGDLGFFEWQNPTEADPCGN